MAKQETFDWLTPLWKACGMLHVSAWLPGFPPVFSLEFPKWTRFGGVKTREDGTQTLTWLLSHGATDEGPEYWRRLPHLGVEAESIMCLEPIWKNPIWDIRDILGFSPTTFESGCLRIPRILNSTHLLVTTYRVRMRSFQVLRSPMRRFGMLALWSFTNHIKSCRCLIFRQQVLFHNHYRLILSEEMMGLKTINAHLPGDPFCFPIKKKVCYLVHLSGRLLAPPKRETNPNKKSIDFFRQSLVSKSKKIQPAWHRLWIWLKPK